MIYKIMNTDLGSMIVLSNNNINTFIPINEANTDYQAYLAWIAMGNTAEEWTNE